MTDVEEKDDNWSPQSHPIPEHWLYTELETAFENLPLTGKKLAQKNYDPAGEIPVVDQGASEIGGYSNDQEKVINPDRPVIIFGDHTKCLKYVTFPFIPGADGVKVLLPNQGVFPKFAFYACKSLRLPDRGYSRHYSFLKKCDFPLPPFNEQKRIVAKIEELFSELDNGIAALKTAREQLKVYRQAVLKHAFEGKLTVQWRKENADKLESPEQLLARIQQEREARYQRQLEDWKDAVKAWEANGKEGKKPGKPSQLPNAQFLSIEEKDQLADLPEGWAWLKVGHLCDVVRGGSPRPAGDSRFYDGDIPFLKVADLTRIEGLYVNNFTYTIKPAGLQKTRSVSPDTLLISNSGATLGVPRICTINATFNDGIAAFLGLDSSELIYHYYFWSSKTSELRAINQGAAQPNLNTDLIKDVAFPVCHPDEMSVVAKSIESMLSVCDKFTSHLNAEISRAETLRQSILKKAFSGQLVPQDPNDEPASELLARIQAEKAAQKAAQKASAKPKTAAKSGAKGGRKPKVAS